MSETNNIAAITSTQAAVVPGQEAVAQGAQAKDAPAALQDALRFHHELAHQAGAEAGKTVEGAVAKDDGKPHRAGKGTAKDDPLKQGDASTDAVAQPTVSQQAVVETAPVAAVIAPAATPHAQAPEPAAAQPLRVKGTGKNAAVVAGQADATAAQARTPVEGEAAVTAAAGKPEVAATPNQATLNLLPGEQSASGVSAAATASIVAAPALVASQPTAVPHANLESFHGATLAHTAPEAQPAAEPTVLLSAAPNALEVGVSGGTHGWLRIRAELSDAGTVTAQLTAQTTAAAEHFERHLPGLSAYLEGEQVKLGALSVQATPAQAGAQDAATASFGGAPSGGSFGGASFDGDAEQRRSQAQTEAAGADRTGIPFEIEAAWPPLAGTSLAATGAGLGGWLSVRV